MNNNNKSLIIENLFDYKYKFSTRNLIITKYYKDTNNNDNSKYKNEKSYYFILDSNNSKDFGFWIFESFIFIDLLNELNKNIKNIKILFKRFNENNNNEIIKILKFFNINNEIVNKIDNYNNICYSPIVYSIYYHHHNLNIDNYFNYHLKYYINYIRTNLDNNYTKYENVFINNNFNNFDDSIIKNYIKNKNKNRIFINELDIKNNFSILNNATNIYLFYNSQFYFNCIFLQGKNIFIIEDNIYRPNGLNSYICGNPFIKYLHNIIMSNNKMSFV